MVERVRYDLESLKVEEFHSEHPVSGELTALQRDGSRLQIRYVEADGQTVRENDQLEWDSDTRLGKTLHHIIVRNWGILIGLVGALLIYGAFNPSARRLALVVATLSKVAFIGLVLSLGSQYVSRVGASLMFDSVLVVLFVLYLVSDKSAHDTS